MVGIVKKNSNALDYALIVLTGVVLFLSIPAYMISIAPYEYKSLDSWLLLKVSVLLLTAYAIVVVLFYEALSRVGLKRVARRMIYIIFFWVTISGFLLPLPEEATTADPFQTPTSKVNFFLVLFLAVVLTATITTKIQKYIVVFYCAFLTITFLSTTSGLYEFFSSEKKTLGQISQLSNAKNIIVISLDGVPSKFANQLINEDDEHQKYFKDFLIFNNAISTNISTQDSIRSELFGVHDFTKMNLKKGGWGLNTDHLLMNQKGYDSSTYGIHYNGFHDEGFREYSFGELREEQYGLDKRLEDVYTFFQYVAVRVGTREVLFVLDKPIRKILDIFLSGLLTTEQDFEENELVLRLKNHQGDSWDKNSILSILDLEGFIKNLSVADQEITLRYLHFDFSHFPVDFDENCSYRSDNNEWFMRNQNTQGVINETKCALKKMHTFLDQLKILGVYDQSLIVIKSDHGKPIPYYSSEPNTYRINGHTLWGYGRYRVMLMVKDFSANNSSPSVNENLVLLSDLANTLCRSLQDGRGCDQFPGINLLSNNFLNGEPFYMFVPKNRDSNFMIQTHKAVKLSRDKDLVQSMIDSKEIELSENHTSDWQALSSVLDMNAEKFEMSESQN